MWFRDTLYSTENREGRRRRDMRGARRRYCPLYRSVAAALALSVAEGSSEAPHAPGVLAPRQARLRKSRHGSQRDRAAQLSQVFRREALPREGAQSRAERTPARPRDHDGNIRAVGFLHGKERKAAAFASRLAVYNRAGNGCGPCPFGQNVTRSWKTD